MKKLTQAQKEILAKVSPEITFILGHEMYGDQAVRFERESELSFFFTNNYFIKHNLIELRKIQKAQIKSEKMNFILDNYFDKKPVEEKPFVLDYGLTDLGQNIEKTTKSLGRMAAQIKLDPSFCNNILSVRSQELDRAKKAKQEKKLCAKQVQINQENHAKLILEDLFDAFLIKNTNQEKELIQNKNYLTIGDKRKINISKYGAEDPADRNIAFDGLVVEILAVTRTVSSIGSVITFSHPTRGIGAAVYSPKLFGGL